MVSRAGDAACLREDAQSREILGPRSVQAEQHRPQFRYREGAERSLGASGCPATAGKWTVVANGVELGWGRSRRAKRSSDDRRNQRSKAPGTRRRLKRGTETSARERGELAACDGPGGEQGRREEKIRRGSEVVDVDVELDPESASVCCVMEGDGTRQTLSLLFLAPFFFFFLFLISRSLLFQFLSLCHANIFDACFLFLRSAPELPVDLVLPPQSLHG